MLALATAPAVYAYDSLKSFMTDFPASPSPATTGKIAARFETGARSVTDNIEDRDLSGNLSFQRYDLEFGQGLSKTTEYNFLYEHYFKNYSTADSLDSTSDEWRASFDHTFLDFKYAPLKLGIDVGLREKDYKLSDSSDYARSSAEMDLDYKYENLWDLDWKSGFVNYEFLKADGDELKLFTKAGGWLKLADERLEIAPSYKYQRVSQRDPSADRSEHIVNIALSYKINAPFLDKVSSFYEFGRNDTRENDYEDRDDALTFKYTRWHISSEHPLAGWIDTTFKYGQNIRKYDTSPNNYHTWYGENRTNLKIFEEEATKINLLIITEHREGDYIDVDTLRYIKNLAGARLSFKVKNNWGVAPSFTYKKYAYRDNPVKNEQDYDVKIELVKEFNRDLDIRITSRNVWKDFRDQPDAKLWSINAGIEYKF